MQQGFNPSGQQGRPNPGFQGQEQQNVNPNAQQGGQNQNFNEVGAQTQKKSEVKQEEVVVEEQNVEVATQVEVTPVVEEVVLQVEAAPVEAIVQAETTQEVKGASGVRSRRLQKLTKTEEDISFKKRR